MVAVSTSDDQYLIDALEERKQTSYGSEQREWPDDDVRFISITSKIGVVPWLDSCFVPADPSAPDLASAFVSHLWAAGYRPGPPSESKSEDGRTVLFDIIALDPSDNWINFMGLVYEHGRPPRQ